MTDHDFTKNRFKYTEHSIGFINDNMGALFENGNVLYWEWIVDIIQLKTRQSGCAKVAIRMVNVSYSHLFIYLFICLGGMQEEWRETAAAVVAGVEMGFLTPFIDKEYQMEDVQEAHANVLSHEGGSRGKLVLTMM